MYQDGLVLWLLISYSHVLAAAVIKGNQEAQNKIIIKLMNKWTEIIIPHDLIIITNFNFLFATMRYTLTT